MFRGWCASYFKKMDYCQGRGTKGAVLRCYGSLNPCDFTTSPSSSETNFVSEVSWRSEGKSASRCLISDPWALLRRGATPREPPRPPPPPLAGPVPPTQAVSWDTEWRAGGHGWERGPSSPGQGSGSQAAVLLRGAPWQWWMLFARGGEQECLCQEPDRRDERDFSGWYLGPPGREDATSPTSAYRARYFTSGAPGGAGRRPAQPPRGCRAEIMCSPHLGDLFDLMCCSGRALTEVVLVSEIGVFVSCSPHTFLTTVITKLIAGPKTDVKTSLKCLSVNNWEGGKTHYLIV